MPFAQCHDDKNAPAPRGLMRRRTKFSVAACLLALVLSACEEREPKYCIDIADECDFTENYCYRHPACRTGFGPDWVVECVPKPEPCRDENSCDCTMCNSDYDLVQCDEAGRFVWSDVHQCFENDAVDSQEVQFQCE